MPIIHDSCDFQDEENFLEFTCPVCDEDMPYSELEVAEYCDKPPFTKHYLCKQCVREGRNTHVCPICNPDDY